MKYETDKTFFKQINSTKKETKQNKMKYFEIKLHFIKRDLLNVYLNIIFKILHVFTANF